MIEAHVYSSPGDEDYGIVRFDWYYPGGILDTSITNADTSSTIYVSWPTGEVHTISLTTWNKWGCPSGSGSVTIEEPPLFEPEYTVEMSTCKNSNGSVTLSTAIPGSPNAYQFTWLDDSTNTLFHGNLGPDVSYGVIVHGESISPDATPGTICHDTISIFVGDTGDVTARFDTVSFVQMQSAPIQLQLTNTSINGWKYSWRIYDEDENLVMTSTAEHPLLTFTEEGCYEILLIATSRDTCKDTTDYRYFCVDATSLLEVPNVFTPNGDGNNDVFQVHSESLVEFHAVIYNRWGKKLYEWDDAAGGWDGKIGGSDASPGVYYYIVTGTGKKDEAYEEKGSFYLMREK
jgi:gliding motility-associated-like protein